MKIYKFEIPYLCNKIEVTEIEAEEKPKSYVLNPKACWESRVLKSEIDVLKTDFGCKMFSLSSDATDFVKSVIKKQEKAIENTKSTLENQMKRKEDLEKLLNDILSDNKKVLKESDNNA